MTRRLTNYAEALSANAPIRVRLGTALARRVAEWMALHGHTDLNHALKDLISVGLAATPEDGIVFNGLTSALADLKKSFLQDAYRFTTTTGERLEAEIVAMGATPGWLREAAAANAETADRLRKRIKDPAKGG